MVRRGESSGSEPLPPPSPTLEGRNDQLTALAMDLVERRMREGTASAQETVHFLRQGSVQAQLQNDKLNNEINVLKARLKESESRRSSEELLQRALDAFGGYAGKTPIDPDQMGDGFGSNVY